jgi:hypothetical protein
VFGRLVGQAPNFAKWAEAVGLSDGERLLAVVTGGDGAAADASGLVDLLKAASTVILDPDSTTIARTVGVRGFPTLIQTGADGVVKVDGYSIDDLRGARLP